MNKKAIFKFFVVTCVMCIIFGYLAQISFAENYNDYSSVSLDTNNELQTYEEILECGVDEIPQLNEDSKKMLDVFEQDELSMKSIRKVEKVYNTISERSYIRVKTENMEINLNQDGEIIKYKNLDDYPDTITKLYKEEDKVEYNYIIQKEDDLEDIIVLIQNTLNLEDYCLVECTNYIEGAWSLKWCKQYENNLVNRYENVSIAIDAIDGSIILLSRNNLEPNSIVPNIDSIVALENAEKYLNNFELEKEENIEIHLNFFKGYEFNNTKNDVLSDELVHLCWEIIIPDQIIIEIDALNGELVFTDSFKSTDHARAMGVCPGDFSWLNEQVSMAYSALNTLGFNQTNYPPVTWAVTQTDMNWQLSRPDCYGLYLCSHGGYDSDGYLVVADSYSPSTATWKIKANTSYGNWHFVFLDACRSGANSSFASCFGINSSTAGRGFVGWYDGVADDTSYAFDLHFFPKLGTMTVRNAVLESKDELDDLGYSGIFACNPRYYGDIYYYGWAW